MITSFHLVPADGQGLWQARPGQYLTLRVPLPGGPVLRTYSLSNAADATDAHRISVKRETLGSVWLHENLVDGTEIEVAGPRGTFHLDDGDTRPVLLLGGGVGVTPLLAMLHRLATGTRRAFFVQAAENGAVHALRDEVAGLAAASGGRIVARTVYRQPAEADRAAGRFDAEGVIDRAFLQSLLPLDDYQVYLCGPTPFMVAMWRLLTSLGVASERIAYEFFGQGASLPALAAAAETAEAAGRPVSRPPSRAPKSLDALAFLTDPDARAAPDGASVPAPKVGLAAAPAAAGDAGADAVVFARSGVTVSATPGASLLEMAEGAGLSPAFSCREGICNTCLTRLVEGSVAYTSDPLDPPPAGTVLLCCSRPVGRVVLDL